MSALLAQTHFRRTWWMGASPASCDPVCHSARFSISVSASTLRFVQRPFTSLRHSASALPRFLRPEDHPVLMLCRCICRSAPIARHFCTKSSIYHPLVIVSTLDLIVLHRHPGISVCSPCSSHRKACICSRRIAMFLPFVLRIHIARRRCPHIACRLGARIRVRSHLHWPVICTYTCCCCSFGSYICESAYILLGGVMDYGPFHIKSRTSIHVCIRRQLL